ncbi:MAG: gliding motility-associated C-terminal domain-containing protein [Bacteroidales bacterium]|nr:gliding motility-associated C-terminal domain-containing protein [Bacteroidales bacterium]
MKTLGFFLGRCKSNINKSKVFKRILTIFLFIFIGNTFSFAQTSVGTDFWFAFLTQPVGGATFKIAVSAEEATSFCVTLPGGSPTTYNVGSNSTTFVTVPESYQTTNFESAQNKGIHLVACKPVSVIYYTFAIAWTSSSKILPTYFCGTKYYVTTYQSAFVNGSLVMILATQNNTQVQYTPAANTWGGKLANTQYSVTLNQGQTFVLMIQDGNDLTGTMVQADKPVVVFGGGATMQIPSTKQYCDPMYEQMIPVDKLGKEFIITPLMKTDLTLVRTLATVNSTSVYIDGSSTPAATINAGKFYEVRFTNNQSHCIRATNPVVVAQYTESGGAATGIGDPAMGMIIPNDGFINKVIFQADNNANYNTDTYVNMVVQSSDVGAATLDGTPIAAGNFSSSGTCPGYSYARLSINNTATHILQSPGGFAGYMYQYDKTTQAADFNNLGVRLPNSPVTGEVKITYDKDSVCAGSCAALSALYPGASPSYSWSNGINGSNTTVCPTVTTTYSVTATSNAVCCIITSVASITIKVNNCSPIVSVNNATVCQGVCATLSATGAGGTAPYTYSWSPATGLSGTTGISVTACPTTTTTYTVKLTDNTAATATAKSVVTVNPLPTVSVNGSSICNGVSFTLAASGAVTYTWNNGLGTGNPKTINPNITTTYNVTGTDGNGCTNTASCVVTVNPLPTITATGGTVCNGSSIIISASGGTTYTWNNGLDAGQTKTVTPSATTTYIVTGTDANGCTGTASCIVVVNSNITPTVNSPTICRGAIATLTASGGNNYTWTPGGQTSVTITVSPTITTTYFVSATNAVGCTGTVVATVTVNPIPSVTVNGGSICNGASFTLTASGATTYNWDNGLGTGNPKTVTPNSTTTYNLTGNDGNGCTNTSLCVVTVNPLPTITTTGGTVCNGSSTAITVAGGATYTWSNSVQGSSQTVTPSVNTTYYVTSTDANGCTGTASCIVVVNNNITPTVNNPTICSGTVATLAASGADNYTWTPGGLTGSTITVNPVTTTTYFVNATNVFGCTGTVVATVTVNPLPTITATGGTICIGASQVISANGAGTYLWDNGLNTGQTKTVTPNVTTTYNVTGTDANGCTGTAFCVVTVNPLPTVTATGGTVCVGAPQIITAGGANTYLWNNGLTGSSQTVTPTATTTYFVTGTDINGCTGTASCVVIVNSSITLTTTGGEICNGASATISVSGAGTGGTYTWSNSVQGNSQVVTPVITTTYFVTGLDQYGCTGTGAAVVIVDQLPSVSATNKTICYGTITTLTAVGSGGISPYNYQWASGTNPATGATVSVSPLVNTTYSITVTDNKGCTATTNVSVIVSPQMTASIQKNDASCGLPNASATVTASGGIPFTMGNSYTYLWSPGSYNTDIINNVVSGTYIVTVTDAVGCTITATTTILDSPPVTLSTSQTPTNCFPNGTATVNILTGTSPYAYTWSTVPPQNTQVATNINSGLYSVTVVDNRGCSNVSSVVVLENNPLSLTTSSTPEHCGQTDGTATANPAGGSPTQGPYTYLWDNGEITQTITSLAQGSYCVTVSYGTCQISKCATVTEKVGPQADFTYSPTVLDIFENSTGFFFDNSTPGGQSIVQWYWEFDDGGCKALNHTQNATHIFRNVGTIMACLKITDSENCMDSICKPVIVKDIFTVYIPNAFSPNEDMLNEGFIPQGYNIDPAGFQMMIFDRWGELIYKTTDINAPWNGRYFNTGEVVQVGVYVYRIIAKEKEGTDHEFLGRISVIR